MRQPEHVYTEPQNVLYPEYLGKKKPGMMKSKDLVIKSEIENLLQSRSSGQNLKSYFENLPDHKVRRAIVILSRICPDKSTVSDDDLEFIICMLSKERYLEQDSFFNFIHSLNLIEFTETQKDALIPVIQKHFETLYENCTFELDNLLVNIFKLPDLFEYMKTLAEEGSTAVLQHIADILRYEHFSDSKVSAEALEILEQKISRKL